MWNPMMEDYNDKSFNSYNRGPGAGLAGTECNKPACKKQNKYSLFVGNIPTEMTEEGLSSLFCQCCDILHVKVCQPRDDSRDTTFGFVDVPSVKDGEEAIRRLDGYAIRNRRLKVSFKREKEKTAVEAPVMQPESTEEWDTPTSKRTPPYASGCNTSSGGSESDGSTSEQKRNPAPQLRKMEDRYGAAKKRVSFEETQALSPTRYESLNRTKSQVLPMEAQDSGCSEKAATSPLKVLLQKMRGTKHDSVCIRVQDQHIKVAEGRGGVEGIGKENNKIDEKVSKQNEKSFSKVPDLTTPKDGPGVGVSKKAETVEGKKTVEEQVKSDSDMKLSKIQDISPCEVTELPHNESGILGSAPLSLLPQPKTFLPLKPPLLPGPLDATTGHCAECTMHEYHETKGSPHSYPYIPHHHSPQPRNGPYPAQCSCCSGGYKPDETRQMLHHHGHVYPHRSPPYPTALYEPAHYGAYPHHIQYAQAFRYGLLPPQGYYEGRDPHHRSYPEGLGSAGYQNSGYQSNRANFTPVSGIKHESQNTKPKSQKALPSLSHPPNSSHSKQPKLAPKDAEAAINPPKSSPIDSQAVHSKEQIIKRSKSKEQLGHTDISLDTKPRDVTSAQRKKDPTASPAQPDQQATQNSSSPGMGSTLPLAVEERSMDETKEGQSGQKDPKHCVYCRKPGHLRCTNCKSTYCSAECQKEDWPKHKQKCRKVMFQDDPSSKNTSTSSSQSSTPTQRSQVIHGGTEGVFMARNLPYETPENVEMQVVVTEVESPSLFWMQLPQESSIKGLLELCESLNTTYIDQSSKTKFSYKAQVGGLCAAWYTADESWYRAEVLSLDNQNCTIQLIDFGTMDVVSVDSLRKLEDKNLKLPKQALRCHLTGVQPILGTWTKEATEKFKTHISKLEGGVIKAKFIGQRSESLEVELYSGDDQTQTLSSILITDGLAEKSTITPQSKPILIKTTPSKAPHSSSVCDNLAVGMCVDVCVSHVESPSSFSAFLADSFESLQELDESMYVCYADTPPQSCFKFHPGKLFAARYSLNQAWYRAVTYEPNTDQKSLLVTFVDYGNSETVGIDECRPLEDRFTKLPWQSISCGLAGIKPNTADGQWTEEMTMALQKHLGNGLSKIVIKAKQADKLMVEIFLNDNEMSFNTWLCNSDCREDTKYSTANRDTTVSAAANQKSASKSTTPRRLLDAKIPQNEFQGFVTVVNSPSDFYLQVDSEDNRNAFKIFSEHLNTRYTLQDFSPYKPSVGDYCAAIFEDSAWYRALVLSYVATELAFKLLFVDYGHTVLLPSDRIRRLEDRFYEMQMMALHCSLTCVAVPSNGCDSEWNDAATRHFRDKVHNQQCLVSIVRCEDGKCLVELLYPVPSANKLVSVKRELLQKGWALMKGFNHCSASKSDDHQLTNETPFAKITPTLDKSGDTCSANHEDVHVHNAPSNKVCVLPAPKLPAEDFQGLVTVVGDHGDVYLQIATQENVDNMLSLTEGINEHYTVVQQRPHEAGVGELCAVRYSVDGAWYRGQVVSHSKADHTANILFVDYGNTEVVSLNEIQKLEKRFMENPRMALHCYLSGLASLSLDKMWNKDATEHLKKKVLDKACHIHITCTKHEGELCGVEILYSNDDANCLSVNQELIDKGLVKPVADQLLPGPSGDHASTNQKQANPEVFKTPEHNQGSPSVKSSFDTNPVNQGNPGVDGPAGLAKLPDNIPPPSEFNGVLTSVVNPCDFYLQIKNEQYIELSQILRAELNQHYPKLGGHPHVPRPGELCTAKYSADNEWYRALALERSESVASAFKVIFLDYGNWEEVPVDQLEKLEGDLLEVPSLAHHCCLSGVMAPSGDKQGPWSPEAAAFISSKLIERDLECHVKVLKHDGKVCEVEIHYSSDDGSQTCNLKEELLKRGLAVPVGVAAKPISDTRLLASSVAKATIPKDSMVNVMVNEVVSPLEFYCQIINRDENMKLRSLMEDINSYAPDHPLTAPPVVGDLCLAKFTVDETWYRSKILKLKQADKRALVYYLDFGNKEPLPWSRLAAASRKFTELPSQAIRCGLKGIPPGYSTDDTMKSFLCQHLIGDATNPPIILQATLDSTTPNGTALVQLVHQDTDTNFNQVVKDMVGLVTSPAQSPTIYPTSSISPAATVVSPKVAVSDPAKREALKREMELKKQQLEAEIEAQRRKLAEVEELRARLEQGL